MRFDKIVELLQADGTAVLSNVLTALFPGKSRVAGQAALRQFRMALAEAAESVKIRVSLETDGQTRSAPENRTVWFEAEDRVIEEVVRMVDAEVGDVERSPQYAVEERPIRFFVSYAHADLDLKTGLLGKLLPLLQTLAKGSVELWSDRKLLPGEKWFAEIKNAMAKCDYGLLLVSPEFLASRFIKEVELKFLLANRQVFPVALKRVLFDGSMKLHELEEHQVFFDQGGKAYSERTPGNPRDQFGLQLFQKIHERLGKLAAPAVSLPKKPRLEDHLRTFVDEFDEGKFVHTEGVATTMSKGLEGAPEIDPRQRKDALVFLNEWLSDGKQPYCALLGEYGMGKTTTCKALAKDLLERRDKNEKVPLPIYLDLRYVGESARQELVLEEILELILKRSWKSGPEQKRLTAPELIALVEKEGALVIWDGLDEVLVHLETHAGQMFTRQLFRILPPAKKGQTRPGKLLISCRTHYFRTLRDQQTHFRAEDRDNVRKEDYRAPFVLLPFTEEQIRQYVKNTLPDEDTDRVMEALGAVHNLREMAERPYTLSLITEQFAQIEQWKAEGRRVTGLTLYRHMVRSWLERDTGKHQLTPDHKQALMEYFAAELWRSGESFWSVEDLEQWLIDFLEARPSLSAHYRGKDVELLKEDLRTATFLVREGEDRFRFAHKSLQEYFLAGYLRRALVEGNLEAWDLPNVSPETLDFLGQWLEEERGAEKPMRTLGKLRDAYRSRASELAFAYFLLAHRKGYPVPIVAGFQLPGANLAEWLVAGDEGSPLVLAGAVFKGATLGKSRWRNCNLDRAVFDGAEGGGVEFLQCDLRESSWREAALDEAVFRDCKMGKASFDRARCIRTQFLRCETAAALGLPSGRPQALYALCGGTVAAPGREAARLTPTSSRGVQVYACAWSPDGSRIVSASYDNALRIWEVATGAVLATLTGHEGWVRDCAWSPDGSRIVSASVDRTLRIWEVSTGAVLVILVGHEHRVNGCAWSPDGSRIVSASGDRTLRIWEASTGAVLVTLAGHGDWVNGCAWSPDGSRIVSASEDQTLRIWEVSTGAVLATLPGHKSYLNGCAWSPDGSRIVSASYDHTLRIWEVSTGSALATLAGHDSYVNGCAWSWDGSRIVSASQDKTLRVWEASTGAVLATLAGHESYVSGCAWSPDGSRIVSASFDCTLRMWDAVNYVEIAPTLYHFTTPDGQPTWAAIDHPNNKILACGAEAWRCLGWVVPEEGTGLPEWLPAETFGPLPVH